MRYNREVKLDVYSKQQRPAKIKLLPSVFSSLYSRIKIFVFAVNSKTHFSIRLGNLSEINVFAVAN